MDSAFPPLRLKGQLRPSQADVVKIAKQKLAAGQKRLHIVAPPGSGKTILGLYLWAECVRLPALVLSPNSAIQAQWAAKTSLFDGVAPQLVSTNSAQPGLLTSLTYQAVTLPRRGGEDLDERALDAWTAALIAKGQAQDPEEARVWIEDLRIHNRGYHDERLGAYRKQVRDAASLDGQALDLLHPSSRAALELLRDRGLGLVILDECHHLMEHWGRVLAAAHELLGGPIVVGLTATPPDTGGKHAEDVKRYGEFFGEVDYEVPVPAVVKDGFLAPYQDLAYFVRPTADELVYVARADQQLQELVDELCQAGEHPALPGWVAETLAERRLPTGQAKDWAAFERRDQDLADAGRLFLILRETPLPDGVPAPALHVPIDQIPKLQILVPVLDRFVRHALRRSPRESDQALADQVTQRLRLLGVQITETGCQACASPVGRVMAYSRSKLQAITPILIAEHQTLGDRLRAVVIADYEKSSATTAQIENLLDAEAGGAVAAFKTIVAHPETDRLDPILVTGSSVLVDDDLVERFQTAAREWLARGGFDVQLEWGREEGFQVLRGTGADWCPRVYVEMITELFQRGLTRCLVGTRGLLGEGWDANKINVLIDLTTVTTSMTVNQLRGRSIRLDPDEPSKLADNWDIVCIAPEFTKGLDDYQRFLAKHAMLFGVTDDGAIEKGVGHVHASFTDLRPEGLEDSVDTLNSEMLARVARRDEVRQRWKIGEPYRGEPKRTIEARPRSSREQGGFPPFAGAKTAWSDEGLALAIGETILAALAEAQLVTSRPQIQAGQRAGGFVRLFLESGTPEENQRFTQALAEALGPLDRPRYIIPRSITRVQDTWLSQKLRSWLPSLVHGTINQAFQQRKNERVMWHAVPSEFAKNKDLVAIYQKHWNRRVSPGDALFAHHGTGETIAADAARKGLVPAAAVQDKEVFF